MCKKSGVDLHQEQDAAVSLFLINSNVGYGEGRR
jgi:hypothetical protein